MQHDKGRIPTALPCLQFGCCRKGKGDNMGRKIDLTGQRFGRLSVVKEYGRQNGHVTWLCKCDCGKTTITCTGDLRQGKTTSCGCYHNEMVSNITRSHEKSNTRLYNIYHNMKQRCNNPKRHDYARYGGAGIGVCTEWMKNPSAFFEWALSNGYSEELTIDRIDVNGNYEPSNCRWATYSEQRINQKRMKDRSIL